MSRRGNCYAHAVMESFFSTDASTTLDVYSHVLPEQQRDAARRLAALLRADSRTHRDSVDDLKSGTEGGIRTPTLLRAPAPQAKGSEGRSKPTPENRGRLSFMVAN
jgi:hypothetical protein